MLHYGKMILLENGVLMNSVVFFYIPFFSFRSAEDQKQDDRDNRTC